MTLVGTTIFGPSNRTPTHLWNFIKAGETPVCFCKLPGILFCDFNVSIFIHFLNSSLLVEDIHNTGFEKQGLINLIIGL